MNKHHLISFSYNNAGRTKVWIEGSDLIRAAAKSDEDHLNLKKEPEAGQSKIKLVLFVLGGIAALCLVLWIIVGRIECFFSDADKDSLTEKIAQKDKEFRNLTNIAESFVENTTLKRTELEAVRNRNAQLQSQIRDMDTEISAVQAKIIEREKINEAIKAQLKKNDAIIIDLKNKLEAQEDEIQDYQDDADEYIGQLRQIWGITSKQLNRNHALEREIELLAAQTSEQMKQIGQLNWEILGLNEKLQEVKAENTLQWLGLTLAESKYGLKVSVDSVYTGSNTNCNSEDFYNKVKTVKPNLFLATENATGLVFGGYTGETWEEGGDNKYKTDASAFTFSASQKLICEQKTQGKAIFTGRTQGTRKLLLTYGEFDISLGDQCIEKNNHEIHANKNYQCPAGVPKNFYTESATPTLSSFAFYKVGLTSPE